MRVVNLMDYFGFFLNDFRNSWVSAWICYDLIRLENSNVDSKFLKFPSRFMLKCFPAFRKRLILRKTHIEWCVSLCLEQSV